MSMAKRLMDERDEMSAVAQKVLVDADLANTCEFCGDVTSEYLEDLTGAYKIANARISTGEIDLPSGWSRKDFTDHLKSEHESLPMECHCQHVMAKDD